MWRYLACFIVFGLFGFCGEVGNTAEPEDGLHPVNKGIISLGQGGAHRVNLKRNTSMRRASVVRRCVARRTRIVLLRAAFRKAYFQRMGYMDANGTIRDDDMIRMRNHVVSRYIKGWTYDPTKLDHPTGNDPTDNIAPRTPPAPPFTTLGILSSHWSADFIHSTHMNLQGGIGKILIPYVDMPSEYSIFPWVDVDTLIIQFGEDVAIMPEDIRIEGKRVANYAIQGFDYDTEMSKVTLILQKPIQSDRVTVSLSPDIYRTADQTTLKSRPWTFSVLEGDIDRNGIVDTDDILGIEQAWGSTLGDRWYSIFYDVNGDGQIDDDDLEIIEKYQWSRVPHAFDVLSGDALWVWEATKDILEHEEDLEQLITFCEQHGVNTVFLSAQMLNPVDPDAQSPSLLTEDRYAQWEHVLAVLHAHGIHAESLCGRADWLMPPGGFLLGGNHFPLKEDRAYGLAIVDDILRYQGAHRDIPAQSFDGVHFDIEIQTLENMYHPIRGGATTERDRVLWFFEFMEGQDQGYEGVCVRRERAGLTREELPFNWDISMNYDKEGHAAVPHVAPAMGDGMMVGKAAWKHLFDRFERITFLTYADRSRFIAAGMKEELAYIDTMSEPPLVRFASEFQSQFKSYDVSPIGFGNENVLAYLNLRQTIESIMVGRSYFQGWAMHTYDNRNPSHGDFRQWIQSQTPIIYPRTFHMKPIGVTKIISRNTVDTIQDPVFVRLNIKAHPMYAHHGLSWPDRAPFEDMIAVIPMGFGYTNSQAITASLDAVVPPAQWDGLIPEHWWYASRIAWWKFPANPDFGLLVKLDLSRHGVAWENPATYDDPDQGVRRDIMLERGKDYRFVVHYIGRTLHWGFVSKHVRANGQEGNSPTNPLEISIYLGETNSPVRYVDDALNQENNKDPGTLIDDYEHHYTEHINQSFVIMDQDGDGLIDAEEMIFGTNPQLFDSDRDGVSDGEEVLQGFIPHNPFSVPPL